MEPSTEQQNQPIVVKIDNYTGQEPIRIIYEEPAPVERLKTIQAKMPEAFNIEGIISAPAAWLEKRAELIDQNNARVEVQREDGVITLIINERDCHPSLSEIADLEKNPENGANDYDYVIMNDIMKKSTVKGTIQFSDVFRKLAINREDAWFDPQKLAAFFRLNRSIFPTIEDAMALTSQLQHLKAKVDADFEKHKDTYTGSRSEIYHQEVSHNLPKSFYIIIPIYKGSKAEKYEVEFDVDIIDGRILLQLKSPAMNDLVQKSLDEIIDRELDRIRTAAPDLVIIEK